ncbi:PREDICTED: serine/arginine repetitive matrix protein 3-like [Elephantulus edwardii]|uniref:serine/arginine repetitive matrix protein 3-like n=1 Tax=Elephantulus edwardii TaxID=28737 RepID=UPI0003F0AE41|nr:PREDICTED: serine/arginine repetitive matrix protein 3-like [Elephantulus edwardii]
MGRSVRTLFEKHHAPRKDGREGGSALGSRGGEEKPSGAAATGGGEARSPRRRGACRRLRAADGGAAVTGSAGRGRGVARHMHSSTRARLRRCLPRARGPGASSVPGVPRLCRLQMSLSVPRTAEPSAGSHDSGAVQGELTATASDQKKKKKPPNNPKQPPPPPRPGKVAGGSYRAAGRAHRGRESAGRLAPRPRPLFLQQRRSKKTGGGKSILSKSATRTGAKTEMARAEPQPAGSAPLIPLPPKKGRDRERLRPKAPGARPAPGRRAPHLVPQRGRGAHGDTRTARAPRGPLPAPGRRHPLLPIPSFLAGEGGHQSTGQTASQDAPVRKGEVRARPGEGARPSACHGTAARRCRRARRRRRGRADRSVGRWAAAAPPEPRPRPAQTAAPLPHRRLAPLAPPSAAPASRQHPSEPPDPVPSDFGRLA